MSGSAIQLLRDLIAIDSVNPSLAAGAAGERELAEAVSSQLKTAGVDVELQPAPAEGRSNVIGVIEGRRRGRTLMLCGHMDTVGVAGYESPFDPVLKDGRVYGRGAQDMKGGLAAMIAAVTHLSRHGLEAGRVVLAAVVDEEYASIGAEALVTKWKADAAVVGEPTDMKIAVGHKGFEWLEITTQGVAAHGSRPNEGRDAILRMGRVLFRLEQLDRDIQRRPIHPILGAGSLHASIIGGGRELSTYPDQCTVQIERRTLTGEPDRCALEEVEQILRELRREDPELQVSAKYMFGRPAYETPPGHVLPQHAGEALRRVGRPAVRDGVTFWTDAAILGAAGIPSIVFGPGGAGLHSICEYVIADDVLACRDVLIELAKEYCSSY
jgi:acetylornithine deacetylase